MREETEASVGQCRPAPGGGQRLLGQQQAIARSGSTGPPGGSGAGWHGQVSSSLDRIEGMVELSRAAVVPTRLRGVRVDRNRSGCPALVLHQSFQMRATTMPFTLCLDGKTVATFDTEEEAVARARAIQRDDSDKQPEILDAETFHPHRTGNRQPGGRPVAPGASKGSRDDLVQPVGECSGSQGASEGWVSYGRTSAAGAALSGGEWVWLRSPGGLDGSRWGTGIAHGRVTTPRIAGTRRLARYGSPNRPEPTETAGYANRPLNLLNNPGTFKLWVGPRNPVPRVPTLG